MFQPEISNKYRQTSLVLWYDEIVNKQRGQFMNIILLSGGSGQRLWPLSNEIRSKQFIKIFHTEDGGLESMVQRVYRQIHEVDPDARVTIATSKTQV